jgi:hypothetical protein
MMDKSGLEPQTSLSSNVKNQNEIVKLNQKKFPVLGPELDARGMASSPQAGQARILSGIRSAMVLFMQARYLPLFNTPSAESKAHSENFLTLCAMRSALCVFIGAKR